MLHVEKVTPIRKKRPTYTFTKPTLMSLLKKEKNQHCITNHFADEKHR